MNEMTQQQMIMQMTRAEHLRADCEKIMEHYGFETQSRILQEECAELIQAVSKLHRDENEQTILNFVEEMADVSIMIMQMLTAREDIQVLYDRFLESKIGRQMRRIENE